MTEQEERIELFSAFRSAMLEYFSLYSKDEEHKKKATISHRIALFLMKYLPSYTTELDYDGVDIEVRDKSNSILSIIWSPTYLNVDEKNKARRHHEEKKPKLTLAFSLLEGKDYLLIYRFEKEYLDYLHINKADFSERRLKRCFIEDEIKDGELELRVNKKRRKKTT